MKENNDETASENAQELDLSNLSALDFNPSWASAGAKKIYVDRSMRDDRRDRRPSRGRDSERDFSAPRGNSGERRRGNSDRRGPRPPRRDFADSSVPAETPATSSPASAPRREFRRDDRRGGDARRKSFDRRSGNVPEFRPPAHVAEIAIFPEDKPFTVLAKAIKNSARTYVLFEIAKIILEKPERFVVVVSPLQKKDKAGKPIESDVSATPFFVSVPDGVPFLNDADALAYVFKNHLDKFFSVEDAEVEPPKGNFTMISKCGFTGELLAPPNYHAYQQILRDHHAANFPKMSFEKFMAHIETVKEQEQIDAWLAKMKKVTRYIVKDRKDDEPEFLDNAVAAKAFMLSNRKDKAVKEVKQARFSGALVEKMPIGPLKTNVEHEIAFQRKFPLNTANGFRGRLRHLGFSLYKNGSKGVTLVCGIKRKFRTPGSVFSETIQRVFDFLEKNPGANLKDLPKLMFGLEEVSDENASAESQIKDLVGTVRWLVTEGYVSEMSDGKLYTFPVMSEAQAKAAAKAEQPIARPEIPSVEDDGELAKIVPEAPAPVIKVIGTLAPESENAPAENVSEPEENAPAESSPDNE